MPVVQQRQSDGASSSSSSDVFRTASSSAQSTIDRIVQYDVFINHRGKDVKDTIADLIYEALQSAESPWCLAELCLILESRAPIIPIFYDVEPSHLRWVTSNGPFHQAFAKHAHNKRFDIHTLEMRKKALHSVSFISGWQLSEFKGQTGKLLKAVVQDVLRRVNSVAASEVDKYPVGLSEKMEKLKGHLQREEKDTGIRIWDASGWSGWLTLQTLCQKCLVEVDEECTRMLMPLMREFKKSTRLRMHDQLREMARDIVNEERISNPGAQAMAPEKCRGLAWQQKCLDTRKLIVLENFTDRQFSRLSQEIVWLRWRYCPYDSIPSGFPMNNLRVLDVAGGKFSSLWQEPGHPDQLPLQLRELDLRLRRSLQKLPESIGMLKRLEKLVLRGCQSLVSVPDEICDIQSLQQLDLSWCDKMESLPLRLGDLRNLKHLDLSFCMLLKTLVPSIGHLTNLQHLMLKGCDESEVLPNSLIKLPLKYLDMHGCSSLEVQSDALENFNGLEYLDSISCERLFLPSPFTAFQRSLIYLHISCPHIKKLPEDFGGLACLEELHIKGSLLTELPFSFGELARLEIFHLYCCPRLLSTGNLKNLSGLFINKCGLEYLPEEIGQLSNLESLAVQDCVNLKNLPINVNSLLKLVNLHLLGNPNLCILPGIFRGLSGLQSLELNRCQLWYPCLASVFECLFSLKKLGLHKSDISIERIMGNSLPNLGSLSLYFSENIREFEIPSTLQSLEIVRWHQLKKVSMCPGLMKLKKLHLRHCSKLVEVSNLSKLSYLEKLDTAGCLKLHTIYEGLEHLKRLKELHIFITDRCLVNANEWWQKLILSPAVLSAIHLSARAIIPNLRTAFHSFEQMKRVSSDDDDLKFEVPPTTKPVSPYAMTSFLNLHNNNNYVLMSPVLWRKPLIGKGNRHRSHSILFSRPSLIWFFAVCLHSTLLTATPFALVFSLIFQGLLDKFLRSAPEIDLRNIYALDIANCRIVRRTNVVHTPLIDEQIGFVWRKRQVLFDGVNSPVHLNVELSRSCMRLIEESSANLFLKISSKMARLLRSRSLWSPMMSSMDALSIPFSSSITVV
eukprot:Gb_27354 [translate_table: standard]